MDSLFSKTVKAGDRTYFIDVKEAKNKSKYMTITESRRSKEDEQKFSRKSVMIFDSQAEKIKGPLEEAMAMLGKQAQ